MHINPADGLTYPGKTDCVGVCRGLGYYSIYQGGMYCDYGFRWLNEPWCEELGCNNWPIHLNFREYSCDNGSCLGDYTLPDCWWFRPRPISYICNPTTVLSSEDRSELEKQINRLMAFTGIESSERKQLQEQLKILRKKAKKQTNKKESNQKQILIDDIIKLQNK